MESAGTKSANIFVKRPMTAFYSQGVGGKAPVTNVDGM